MRVTAWPFQRFTSLGIVLFVASLTLGFLPRHAAAQCDPAALADGGFEAGDTETQWTPVGDGPNWSAGFILEDAESAHAGNWSATMGGVQDEAYRNGFSQVLPAFAAEDVLSLYIRVEPSYSCIDGQGEVPICDPFYDFTVALDETILLEVFEGDASFHTGYVLATFRMAAFANGNPHTLTIAGRSEGTVYLVDDVCISPRGTGSGAPAATYDTTPDNVVDLSELLRVIQFYNAGGHHCVGEEEVESEDGYTPGPGDTSCAPYSADVNPTDWKISLGELLRVIQFYNRGGYYACPVANTEDGFCTL